MDPSTLASLLSISIFLPLLGLPLIALLPAGAGKRIALGTSLAVLVTTALMVFNRGSFPEDAFWILESSNWFGMSDLDIKYIVGMDGISALLVLLTALVFPLVIVYTWADDISQPKLFYMMLLLVETGLIGFFVSLDLMMMYVFFELVLIPASFLIGIWGDERRGEASLKFFLYTLVGSLVMLVAIIYTGIQVADYQLEGVSLTTDYRLIQETLLLGMQQDIPGLDVSAQTWIFLAFALSFAIKSPLFPLHTWQPLAYASASTSGSVVLGALMSKMGTYGFIRFCLPLFPGIMEENAYLLSALAVVGIIYGAYMAVSQVDIKRLLAYSSLSHMGFILLGIFAGSEEALHGAVLQMVAHGVTTTALFFLADMMEKRYNSRLISDYQGIAKAAPIFTFLFMVSVMASVGLPGLSGFVGEFLIMAGAFQGSWLTGTFAVMAAIGVILAAVYLLNMFRKVMFGTLEADANPFADANRREIGVMVPLLILMFWIGLYATPFLNTIDQYDGKQGAKVVQVTEEPPLDVARN